MSPKTTSRSRLPLALLLAAAALLGGCGNADTAGEGFVTVQGLATGQALLCGQQGGQGQGSTLNILGSGFLSEHGINVTVVFTATVGTPFQGGMSATADVPAQVMTDTLIVSGVPNFNGSAIVTLTVILPGGNLGISVPGQVSIGGFLDGPYAFSDRYETGLNQELTVPADQGPLVNDFGRQCIPDGQEPSSQSSPPSVTGFTIASYDAITQNGGTVMMGPDGAFTYTPPSGFEGFDRFGYTMDDMGFTSSATVFIGVNTGSSTTSTR